MAPYCFVNIMGDTDNPPFFSELEKSGVISVIILPTYVSAALGTIIPPPSILTVRPAKATRISSTDSGLPRPAPRPKTDSEKAARCRPLIVALLAWN